MNGLEKKVLEDWTNRWRNSRKVEYLDLGGRWYILVDTALNKRVLQLHSQFRKAESSLLVQIRTGQIGLAKFLYSQRLPSYVIASCRCGEGEETLQHMALYYAYKQNRRHLLPSPRGGPVDYQRLVGIGEGAKIITE